MKKKVIELLLQQNNKLARQRNDFIFDLRRGLMQCGSFGDCRVRNGKKYRNMVTLTWSILIWRTEENPGSKMVDLCFQVFVQYIFLTFLSVYKKFVPPIEVFQISSLRGHLFFTYLFKAQEVNGLVSILYTKPFFSRNCTGTVNNWRCSCSICTTT